MSRIANKLTKEQLQNWGIIAVEWSEDENRWVVLRKWWPNRIGNSKNMIITQLQESIATAHHKYGQDKFYLKYTFSAFGKSHSISVARLVLAWILGEVPEGYDACHRDNNEINNAPDNIFIDTHANNIKQRNLYYQISCFNQHHNTEHE